MTRDQIITRLREVQKEGEAYWNKFDDARFFARFGDNWSPVETVRHLTKSTRPVAKALRLPRLVLLLLFGLRKRPSESYEQLTERYEMLLAEGGQAGVFAPTATSSRDREAVMSVSASVMEDLIKGVKGWGDKSLDRFQLPHPLLGKLTVREMLMFTIYHHIHHREVIQRRVAAST